MRRLLNLLQSERSIVVGAIGSLSDEFGWNRAVARILGFFILWGAPYCLGATTRNAWWITILLYVGLGLMVRKLSYVGRYRDPGLARRWKARRHPNQNHCHQTSGTPAPQEAQAHDKERMIISSPPPPPPKISGSGNLLTESIGDSLSDLERRLAKLDQRIQKMESTVTDRSFDWDRRLRHP